MRRSALIARSMSLAVIACSDPARRTLGATCGDDAQCASGLCHANQCVDPAGDEDGDGLTNSVEAAPGTDAFVVDTDLDGKDDLTERGTGSSPTATDGDGHPDGVESAIANADRDCIPDELAPEDAGLDPNGCGPGDTHSPDADDGEVDGPDTLDTLDAVEVEVDGADAAEVGPSDTHTPLDATDTEDAETDAPDVEPTARCDGPVLVMSETLGHFFTGPVAVGGAGSQAVITFQSGTRQHYALRSGHFGWVGPELMMSGVDTNPSIEPAPVSASDRLVAYRADDELSRSPAVIALTPEGDPLIVWGSNIGNGARVNATTCR